VPTRLGVLQVLVSAILAQLVNPVFTLQLIVMSHMIGDARSVQQGHTAQRLMNPNVQLVKMKLGALLVLQVVQRVLHVDQVFMP